MPFFLDLFEFIKLQVNRRHYTVYFAKWLVSLYTVVQNVRADMSFSLRADPQEAFAHWELSEGTALIHC